MSATESVKFIERDGQEVMDEAWEMRAQWRDQFNDRKKPLAWLVGPAEYYAIIRYVQSARRHSYVSAIGMSMGQLQTLFGIEVKTKAQAGLDFEIDPRDSKFFLLKLDKVAPV